MEKLNFGDMNVVCLMKFGSHLYGTNTPESDTDYKGIFMPSREQILLGNIPKSVRFDSNTSNEKNSKDDIDCEMYSLHYFLELAAKGETAALDMLHCSPVALLSGSMAWDSLVAQRSKFYTKNLKAFVGYARKQAAKYGLKGSRLDAAEKVMKVLREYPAHHRLGELRTFLPINEHCFFVPTEVTGVSNYQVCGKQLQFTARIDYVYKILNEFVNTYGERAKKAKRNEGVDWKAMSHAVRAAYQVREILETDNLVFPLKCADVLVAIKNGEMAFNNVLEMLEDLMDSVEQLSEISNLPSKVNRNHFDKWLINILEMEVLK